MRPCPLPQSDAFGRTLRVLGTEARIERVRDAGGGAIGHCLIQTRRLPLIGPVNLITRGPVLDDPDQALRFLAKLNLKGPLFVNSPGPDISISGFFRIAKPSAIALLPLSTHTEMRRRMHQKWRNALTRAENANLSVEMSVFDPNAHQWLINAEKIQQRKRGYRNWPPRFLHAFAQVNPQQAKVFTAHANNQPVAAMLILCHPPWATYHLGVTTPVGRRTAAHNLTLWHAMTWLTDHGFTTLDLGQLTGPDGLDRFKLRTGAMSHTLGGTWIRKPKALRRGAQLPSIHSPSGQNA